MTLISLWRQKAVDKIRCQGQQLQNVYFYSFRQACSFQCVLPNDQDMTEMPHVEWLDIIGVMRQRTSPMILIEADVESQSENSH